MLTVGESMARCRRRKGLTQRELGELTEISHNLIGYYEQDKVAPGLFNVITIADALQVSIDELVGREFKHEESNDNT